MIAIITFIPIWIVVVWLIKNPTAKNFLKILYFFGFAVSMLIIYTIMMQMASQIVEVSGKTMELKKTEFHMTDELWLLIISNAVYWIIVCVAGKKLHK